MGTVNKIQRVWYNIELRCSYEKLPVYRYYGGRGIRNLISVMELRQLWDRDGADSMHKPSIDRIDNDGNYTFQNCRFIELADNIRKARQVLCSACQKTRGSRKDGLCRACKKTCRNCGIVLRSRKQLCADCRTVSRPCAHCGAIVTRDRVTERGSLCNKQWFCSKQHQGAWLGARYGRKFQSRKEVSA